MKITLNVNGTDYAVEIAPCELLLDVLREKLGFLSVKRGCETGDCGACTVLIDDLPVDACVYLAIRAEHKRILTLEGVGTFRNLSDLQRNMKDLLGFQCGFCAPGMILTAAALLRAIENPTEAEIRAHLAGNLCRCSGYANIVAAIRKTAAERQEARHGET